MRGPGPQSPTPDSAHDKPGIFFSEFWPVFSMKQYFSPIRIYAFLCFSQRKTKNEKVVGVIGFHCLKVAKEINMRFGCVF